MESHVHCTQCTCLNCHTLVQVRWDSVSALDDVTMEVDQFDISSEGEREREREREREDEGKRGREREKDREGEREG